ncbi:MAG: hypothetical protein Q9208_004188 [Pyrenodesmia sp. 3 TL-2023]
MMLVLIHYVQFSVCVEASRDAGLSDNDANSQFGSEAKANHAKCQDSQANIAQLATTSDALQYVLRTALTFLDAIHVIYRILADTPAYSAFVRLDIEKTRLLIWANKVKLFSSEEWYHGPHLRAQEPILSEQLEELEKLFKRVALNPKDFGLHMDEMMTSPRFVPPPMSVMSQMELVSAYKHNVELYSVLDPPQRGTPRAQLLITDAAKFPFLAKPLKENIDRLYKTIAVESRCQDTEVEKSIRSIAFIPDLIVIKAALAEDFGLWSDRASDRIKSLRRLESHVALHELRSELSEGASPEELQESTSSRANPTKTAAYVYVAPCERLIGQALGICWETDRWNADEVFRTLVRVDNHLSILHHVHSAKKQVEESFYKYFDETWLEQRVHETMMQGELDANAPRSMVHCFAESSYSTWEVVAAIIVIGEEEPVRKAMCLQSPHTRENQIPSATEMYRMDVSDGSKVSHRFFGKYRRNPDLFRPGELERLREVISQQMGSSSGTVTPADAAPSAKRRRVR